MRAVLAIMILALVPATVGLAEGGGNNTDPPGLIQLQAVGFSQWEQVLADQRGNIAVVDVWASWCSPCIERFPHMVTLHHRYRERGVRFLSLNLDEQGDADALQWVGEFLRRVEAVFPNYHLDENMTQAFERLDLLGLPVVLIYDTDGTEAHRLTGDDPNNQFSEQDVEKAVLDLLTRTP